MAFPQFFSQVPTIRLFDPLAQFLGASDDGTIEYGYSDAVKLAGHSCPTVASAYLMTMRGVKALYGDQPPVRGEISVQLADAANNGTTGVIASVASFITGARGEDGFKGIGGRFARNDLLAFEQPMDNPLTILSFGRVDNGRRIDVAFNFGLVTSSPEMPDLLRSVIEGYASECDRIRFAFLWQDRVRRILIDHHNDPKLITLTPL